LKARRENPTRPTAATSGTPPVAAALSIARNLFGVEFRAPVAETRRVSDFGTVAGVADPSSSVAFFLIAGLSTSLFAVPANLYPVNGDRS
jgi:hypothetical protein